MKKTSGNCFRKTIRAPALTDWFMAYWIHVARSIDRVTLHRDRCSEIPSNVTSSDFWEGGWFDYPDKERALHAMEQAGVGEQRRCPLCKP
ncbi:MAG: hypothetical protein NNA18_02955 [Nitrospira sp.]|nr:hypothetical protein [Nitrospira sp.]